MAFDVYDRNAGGGGAQGADGGERARGCMAPRVRLRTLEGRVAEVYAVAKAAILEDAAKEGITATAKKRRRRPLRFIYAYERRSGAPRSGRSGEL